MRAEIYRLREERRWVSVGERLPGDGHIVFATDGSHVDELRYFAGFGFECLGGDDPPWVVTHWQPLPPGPEGEG